MGLGKRETLEQADGRGEVQFAFVGESGHQVAAKTEVRHERCRRRNDFVHVVDQIGAAHGLENPVGSRLDWQMQETADVRALGHGANGFQRADFGFDRSQPDAAAGVNVRERKQQVVQTFPLRGVEREIAAGHDDLVVARIDKALGLIEDADEINGFRGAAELRHDAKRAFSRTAVLNLKVSAGRADRHGNFIRLRILSRFAPDVDEAGDVEPFPAVAFGSSPSSASGKLIP